MRRRTAVALAAVAGIAALALVPLASALACTARTQFSLATPSASPGTQVSGTGMYFSNASGSAAAAGPVQVWFARHTSERSCGRVGPTHPARCG